MAIASADGDDRRVAASGRGRTSDRQTVRLRQGSAVLGRIRLEILHPERMSMPDDKDPEQNPDVSSGDELQPSERKPVSYHDAPVEGGSVEDSVHIRLIDTSKKVRTEGLSGFGGRNAVVDFDDAGGAALRGAGTPRQGAHGEKDAVHRAAAFMRAKGLLAADPVEVRGHDDDKDLREPIDCVVLAQDGTKLFAAQVVRAAGDLALASLGRTGSFAGSFSTGALADAMMGAIAKKALKYDSVTKRGIVLVLDAMDHHLAMATEPVVEDFLLRHGAQAKASGFDAVILVGPSREVRLDEPPNSL